MDEGKVALIASAIGFVGALMGAGIGGWAAVRGAKQQAAAALEQTARAGLQDQQRWIRDRRHESCARLYNVLEEAAHEAMSFQALGRHRDRDAVVRYRTVVAQQIKNLSAARTVVVLVCPEYVGESAGDATTAAVDMMNASAFEAEEFDRAADRFVAVHQSFRASIRTMLALHDED